MLVYGGGNVAYDVARSSVRLGAGSAWSASRAARKGQMTADDGGDRSGCGRGRELYSGYSNSGFSTDENGKVTGLNCFAISDFRFGPSGLEVDKVEGQRSVRALRYGRLRLRSEDQPDRRVRPGDQSPGYPVDPETGKSGFKTSVEGVYTAGDVITGTKSVISAIAGGRGAAARIDAILGGDGNIDEKLVEVLPPIPISAGSRALPSCPVRRKTSPLCRAQVLLCQGGQQLHRGTGSGRGGAVPEVPAAPADPPHQAVDGILMRGVAHYEEDL